MPLRFDDKSPIYQQLCDYFENQILNGSFSIGQKMPSVRDLAMEIGVNPNTMQKSLSMLESKGLMFTERTSGRFITKNQTAIDQLRIQRTERLKKQYIEEMIKIGYDEKGAIDLLREGTKLEN